VTVAVQRHRARALAVGHGYDAIYGINIIADARRALPMTEARRIE
jgi:hypothetical protein